MTTRIQVLLCAVMVISTLTIAQYTFTTLAQTDSKSPAPVKTDTPAKPAMLYQVTQDIYSEFMEKADLRFALIQQKYENDQKQLILDQQAGEQAQKTLEETYVQVMDKLGIPKDQQRFYQMQRDLQKGYVLVRVEPKK